jgi:hypothetical protein
VSIKRCLCGAAQRHHVPPGTPAATTPGTATVASISRTCSGGSIGTPASSPILPLSKHVNHSPMYVQSATRSRDILAQMCAYLHKRIAYQYQRPDDSGIDICQLLVLSHQSVNGSCIQCGRSLCACALLVCTYLRCWYRRTRSDTLSVCSCS